MYCFKSCPLNFEDLPIFQLMVDVFLEFIQRVAFVLVESDFWYYGLELLDTPNVITMPVC